jgi:hypothetical protein
MTFPTPLDPPLHVSSPFYLILPSTYSRSPHFFLFLWLLVPQVAPSLYGLVSLPLMSERLLLSTSESFLLINWSFLPKVREPLFPLMNRSFPM